MGAFSEEWLATQREQSEHSREFWQEISRMVIDGRTAIGMPADTTLGSYGYTAPGPAELLVDRNNRGIDLERRGEVDAAIIVYEVSVADGFDGTHPYDRLRIIYAKRKWYKDAIRVCRAYLELPDRPVGQDKAHFRRHFEKLLAKHECLSKRVDAGTVLSG